MLRVAWLFPKPKRALLEQHSRGQVPDQVSGALAIREFGIKPTLLDPFPFPVNPLLGMHSLYSGIDPMRALRLLLTRRRYDLILSVAESSALIVLQLRRLGLLRLPVVVWDPCLNWAWRRRRWVLDSVLPQAERVLVIGSNQAQRIRERYGTRCRTAVIYHWEDVEFYRPVESTPGGYVLSVGDDIGRDFGTLVLASCGLQQDVRIRSGRDLRLCGELPANVAHIRDRISYADLRDLYAGAAFVVVPLTDSIHASGVNTVLESMAMGKATIVSASEGIIDFIEDGHTGVLVPPGNPTALRAAMERLQAHPEEAARLGRNARAAVESRFSSRSFAQRLAEELWSCHDDFRGTSR